MPAGKSLAGVVCADRSLDDTVLAIDQPLENVAMQISAQFGRNVKHCLVWLQAGEQVYDCRSEPWWTGKADRVFIEWPYPIHSAACVKADLGDELAVFLKTEHVTWGQPNLLRRDIRLLGFSWDRLLLCMFVGAGVAVWLLLRLKGKRCSLAGILLSSFLAAWLLMDVRTMVDHAYWMRWLDDVYLFRLVNELAEKGESVAEEVNAAGGPWCEQRFEFPYYTLLPYVLAETPYVPGKSCQYTLRAVGANLFVNGEPR